jgi:hypothetical protein
MLGVIGLIVRLRLIVQINKLFQLIREIISETGSGYRWSALISFQMSSSGVLSMESKVGALHEL